MTPADEAGMKPEEIVVECEMAAAPEKLWRALTEEPFLADWLGGEPAGEKGEERNGPRYQVVEAEPYSRVRYAWLDPDHPDAPPMVTVELERLSGGRTWFRLTHGGSAESGLVAVNRNSPPLALAA